MAEKKSLPSWKWSFSSEIEDASYVARYVATRAFDFATRWNITGEFVSVWGNQIMFPRWWETRISKPMHFFHKKIDRDRTRTCNPQFRSLVPYPLGHTVFWLWWNGNFLELWCFFARYVATPSFDLSIANFSLILQYIANVTQYCTNSIKSFIIFSDFLTIKIDHDRTRTCNPQIRSLMPYPLGHMALLGIRI